MFALSSMAEGQPLSIRGERSLIAICLMRRRAWPPLYLTAERIFTKTARRFW